jgi:GNAT superfamily N-acetyltransferase
MKVQLIESVDEFLSLTAQRRCADPLRTNVISTVAQSVRSGRRRYDGYRWWVVSDDGVIVALAMRTTPFAMVLAPMARDAALALGRALGRLDDELPGLLGSREVVDDVLDGYRSSASSGSRRRTHVGRHERMYEVGTLVTPTVDGRGRPAHGDEAESLATMFTDFASEVDLQPVSIAEAREGVANALLEESLFCWEHDATLVSFAGHAPVVATGEDLIARVGPVYTPPAFRGHGYASAVTALVTQRLLDQGARVMLFTDAANRTSNAIYQALGYYLIDELVDVRFDER